MAHLSEKTKWIMKDTLRLFAYLLLAMAILLMLGIKAAGY